MDIDAEIESVEALDALSENLREFIDAIDEDSNTTLRLAIHFSGDDITPLFVRDDLREAHSEGDLDAMIQSLAMTGLSDPPSEEDTDFGTLESTVRWYSDVVVASFPLRAWSGLVFTFDRDATPVLELAQGLLD